MQSRGCALNRVYNSRRPLDRLFALSDRVTLTFLPNINWWVKYRDGLLCAKFGDYRAGRQTESQTRMIAILMQLLLAWVNIRTQVEGTCITVTRLDYKQNLDCLIGIQHFQHR